MFYLNDPVTKIPVAIVRTRKRRVHFLFWSWTRRETLIRYHCYISGCPPWEMEVWV